MKRRIKIFLSLIYTVVFAVLASTGVLHSQASELEPAPADLNLGLEPKNTELERTNDYSEIFFRNL